MDCTSPDRGTCLTYQCVYVKEICVDGGQVYRNQANSNLYGGGWGTSPFTSDQCGHTPKLPHAYTCTVHTPRLNHLGKDHHIIIHE